jgi:hypothetical protein
MSATTLSLTIESGVLDARSSWMEFESLAVQMSREVPLRALEETLSEAQERLIDSVRGLRWAPVRGLPAPFACPGCEMAEDFARKGKRIRRRKLHTGAGTVELVLWHVGCRECGRVFAPLLVMLGLSGKRRTDPAEGGAGHPGQLRTGGGVVPGASRDHRHSGAGAQRAGRYRRVADRRRGHPGAGARQPGRGDARWHRCPHRDEQNGVGVHLALRLTGRSGPAGRRRAHTHLLGLTVGEDWPTMAAQLAGLPAPALVVLDGETELTTLTQQLWPTTTIQRCWWHLPTDCARPSTPTTPPTATPTPHWALHMSDQLGELPRDTIRHEQTTEQALAAARNHAFTCLDPDLRSRLVRLGGPELGTGVLERVMREINARTDIGARPLEHRRTTRPTHRAHRTTAPPSSLERDQTGHPPAQHHPIPPAKVQRLTTLPKYPHPPNPPHTLRHNRTPQPPGCNTTPPHRTFAYSG